MTGIVDYTPSKSVYREYFKRVFDVVFVLAAAVVIVPVVAILCFLVALDGSSPFFIQRRVGKGGRLFSMVKLRSMVPNADRKLAVYLASNGEARAEWDRTQKLKHDPRVTWVGRLIRKTSLDELPQFWNVLMGSMSVVGPRPMMPSQRDLYPGQAYFALKPGVTGFWQIGDRNNTSFAARARYDAEYYKKSSMTTDLWVIARTLKVVVRMTGV
ncbi:sugar transferase [Pseudoruegeria sp. SK021]|uniref:sugar transferase n=1 Tax=Pseudoruegeria sp. SK021 TaxID=1933035 RepID=UPI001F0AB4F2|nr:sugar transferase [Pseudoruegeria sp. SK021]